MNKKVFIDFGSGPKMEMAIKFKLDGFYVTIVNKRVSELFRNIGKMRDMEYYKMIADEICNFDLSDLNNKCKYKADAWHCGAVLEHVELENIDNFLQNIRNNSKDKFYGTLNIDLTDHVGGFKHYENPSKYFDEGIRNTLKHDEWYNIINKHFTIKKYNKQYRVNNRYAHPSTLFFDVTE